MLTAIASQHKLINSPHKSLNSKGIEIDAVQCLPSFTRCISQLDVIDNPVAISEFSETERNIFKQMKYERNRLYSFQNKWPLQDITPESLAEAGLFYLQHEDKVQCPFCMVTISNWINGDKPLREHMRRRPKCPFLMGCDVGNVPLAPGRHQMPLDSISGRSCLSHSYKPKHPRMADIKRRILTFSGWPLSVPKPQQLAECGLYYSGIADVVTCFFCGGTLGNWEPNDDPWNEHRKFFPDCAFLDAAKNNNPSLKLASPCRKESKESAEFKQHLVAVIPSTDITSNIIEEAQDIFPENLVLEAVKRKGGNILSLQEICDDILELKQEQKEKTTALTSDDTLLNANSNPSNVDALLCKVCMDREKGAVFQPCGHFVSCWTCANLIANCPVCRRPITHKIRTYIS